MRRDDDLNRSNNITRPNNSRRNRALNLTQDEFEQISDTFEENLTLESDEIEEITRNNEDTLKLTPQQMNQIREEYDSGNQTSMQNTSNTSRATTQNTDLVYNYLQSIIGRFIFVDFLIGTQCMVRKQGYLFDAGSNWILLYDDILNIFIMCDLYSIKFITFPSQKPTTSVNSVPMYQMSSTSNQQQATMSQRRRR